MSVSVNRSNRWPILSLLLAFSLVALSSAKEPDAQVVGLQSLKAAPAKHAKASLADAAEAQDWSLVAKLLDQGSDIDLSQADGMTALHWAVYRNHQAAVRQLINAKSNVNSRTQYEITPLSIACAVGNPTVIHHLLTAALSH